MDKIYIFGIYTGQSSYGVIRDAEPCGDVIGYAVDGIVIDEEDGKEKLNCIASHVSSGETFCKHDMGLTSNWKHDIYKELHPDGYELEFLGFFDDTKESVRTVKEMINQRMR